MYLISRGAVDVVDRDGHVIRTLRDGEFFGEIALLMETPRTATVVAKTQCDYFVIRKPEFRRILREHRQFADAMAAIARERYDIALSSDELMGE